MTDSPGSGHAIDEPQPGVTGPGAAPPTPGPELPPGAGVAFRPGPPASVSTGLPATRINRAVGMGAVVLILALIIIVVLVGLLVISVLTRH
ncbi:MAG: hypothetical protein ACYDGR_15415 [Candidatus Dormibacteria bacterium]